jgi:hypothetical protein
MENSDEIIIKNILDLKINHIIYGYNFIKTLHLLKLNMY